MEIISVEQKREDGFIEPGQSYEVDIFRPADAAGVTRLFRSVYGDGYPIRTFMQPELLIEENLARRTISSVARTARGDIVGHNALFNSGTHPGIYESGAGVVHAAYRGGRGIFTKMANHCLELAAAFPHINAAFGEPVCNHVISQKLVEKSGFVPRALEVDLMPAAAYEKEASAPGRVAAFLSFKTYRLRPHVVYLPALYSEELAFLYEGLDDTREFRAADGGISPEKISDIRPRIFASAGVARIALHEPGEDFPLRMEKLEAELKEGGIQVIQFWLNLACPGVGMATDVLRKRGFFLGGALPRWFDSDGLLMQKILKRPDWEEIKVYGERAALILKMVKTDWEKTRDDG